MKFVFLFIVFALIRSVYALITKGTSAVGGYGCGDDKVSPIIGNDPLDPSSIDLFADCNDFN